MKKNKKINKPSFCYSRKVQNKPIHSRYTKMNTTKIKDRNKRNPRENKIRK